MSEYDIKASEVSNEFQLKIKEIFEENLVFGFIYGGIAKGYALTSDHDIDMLVCVKKLNQIQIDKFKEFYFHIHQKYEYTPDMELSWNVLDTNSPREFVTFTEILEIINRLSDLKISLIIKYFKEYEAIVVCDIFAGQLTAKVGNIKMLELIQLYCEKLPAQWRKEIVEKLDKHIIDTEMHLIEKLNITRLFRRYVTYLKKDNDDVKPLNVCILGGGGNVAEAVCAKLIANGHHLAQFRFATQKVIPGVPQRPVRSLDRIKEIKFIKATPEEESLISKQIETITSENYEFFDKFDVFIYAYPSYMAECVAKELGKHLIGKPLVNLSDRFLGSYTLVKEMQKNYGPTAVPSVCAAFNGVPIMALKETRDTPTTIYYVKPKHSISWYPQTREGRTKAISILLDLFKFHESCLIPYPNMLHLAFENTHCIEHAVVDLYNLKKENYSDSSNKLYSDTLYKNECISRIERIVNERNLVSKKLVGRTFYSLKDYDVKVFGNSQTTNFDNAGTDKYRIEHKCLSKAPNLSTTTAFGYEDIGWSMVTLESFAKTYGIQTPELSALIDEWNEYMKCDYRLIGRTIEKLELLNANTTNFIDYRNLSWNENFMTEEAKNAILKN